jgi:hypothetical protein
VGVERAGAVTAGQHKEARTGERVGSHTLLQRVASRSRGIYDHKKQSMGTHRPYRRCVAFVVARIDG